MSPAERAAEVRQHKDEEEELTRAAIANLRRLCFGSFSALDLLWIAVGLLAAFCIASGRTF